MSRSYRAGWPHLLIVLPCLGALLVAALWARATGALRRELGAAIVCQLTAFGVLAMHAALQLGVIAIGWLRARSPDGADLTFIPVLLTICTWLNVGAGVVEWGALAVTAVRAAAGHPYPLAGDR